MTALVSWWILQVKLHSGILSYGYRVQSERNTRNSLHRCQQGHEYCHTIQSGWVQNKECMSTGKKNLSIVVFGLLLPLTVYCCVLEEMF